MAKELLNTFFFKEKRKKKCVYISSDARWLTKKPSMCIFLTDYEKGEGTEGSVARWRCRYLPPSGVLDTWLDET